MKVFVTGVGGQLGHDVVNELARRDYDSVGSDVQAIYSGVADESAVTKAPYVQLDITNGKEVQKTVEKIHPDVIIHCAAWTNVDGAETDKYGYYHATNEGGYISWYDFCCEFYKQCGMVTKVIPVTTAEYGLSAAVRPFNSRLEKSKLVKAGFKPLPAWQDAVSRYLKEAEL